jgi:uncharacterized protein with von Willebrand factor type A (vWA) domain
MSQSGLILPGDVEAAPENGQPKPKVAPSLWLEFDPTTQSVAVQINPEKIKTWDFARALCVMAQQACERMAELQMARAAHEAMQNNALADQVSRDLRVKR